MVYTLTINPSLDYVTFVNNFIYGEVNRSSKEFIYPGGKGINVSIILHRLGIKTKALGFKAGFSGGILEKMLESNGIPHELIPLENGNTRINLKIKTGSETEINGNGPIIPTESINLLLHNLDKLNNNDTLVMAGSLPPSVSENIYGIIAEKMNIKGVKFIIDAAGNVLKNSLRFKPFLIKPNLSELFELFGSKSEKKSDIIKNARMLQEAGALNVLVSMAEKGALLIDEVGMIHEMNAPDGKLINSTGSGDSMVAGFIAGWNEYNDYRKALKLGIAAGSATAFKEWLAEKDEIFNQYNNTR